MAATGSSSGAGRRVLDSAGRDSLAGSAQPLRRLELGLSPVQAVDAGGALDAMLEALNATGEGRANVQMIDSTIIRAHQHAAGALKKGMRTKVLAALAVASRPRYISAATLEASLSRLV